MYYQNQSRFDSRLNKDYFSTLNTTDSSHYLEKIIKFTKRSLSVS